MAKNKSVVITGHTSPISYKIEDRDIPVPSPGTVVVKVLAAPLLDYFKNTLDGSLPYPNPVPYTPGGIAVARVHSVGPDAVRLKEGDLVIVDYAVSARDDPSVQIVLGTFSGAGPACSILAGDAWRNGVHAQYAALPLENVFILDEDRLIGELGYDVLDLHLIHTCMVPYGGLADAAVRAGDTVVVAPATGRFSGAAVLVALTMGAKVVALGRRQHALDELVKSLGNPHGLRPATMVGNVEKDTATLAQAVGPRGADCVLDFSPPAAGAYGVTPSYLAASINVLRRGGTLSLMGGIVGGVEIPYITVLFKNLIVRGRFVYERHHAEQVIKLVESGKLRIGQQVGMTTAAIFGLEHYERALDEAEKLPGWGKIIQIMP